MNTLSAFLRWSCSLLLLVSFVACQGDRSPSKIKTSWTKTELDQLNVYTIPGDYYEMSMGVKGNKLTGLYRHPKNPNCQFFFEGSIGTQNPIVVSCYDPTTSNPPIQGTFEIIGDAIIAQLPRLPHQDCPTEFSGDVGYSMILDVKHNWSAIRMVQHPAKLYRHPSTDAIQMETVLQKGDAVAVVNQQKLWLEVILLNGNPTERFWIERHQLYPLLETY